MLPTSGQHGFTLIEVLISALILSIGLLGLAGLQSKALRYNTSAYMVTQATSLAYQIADRMRANPAGDYTLANLGSSHSAASCQGAVTACTPAQMVAFDLNEWKRNLRAALNAGDGAIHYSAPVYTITIVWDDNRDGDANDSGEQFTYQIRLTP